MNFLKSEEIGQNICNEKNLEFEIWVDHQLGWDMGLAPAFFMGTNFVKTGGDIPPHSIHTLSVVLEQNSISSSFMFICILLPYLKHAAAGNTLNMS